MAYLTLKNINKIYPNGFHAVHDFCMEAEKGEFIVFVGPSGCGKSTTLRMIAGLEDISKGEFLINGRLANQLSPRDREVAMVFQSYALYPHMTVYDNLAFGLSLQGVDEDVIDERVQKTAKILGLTDYLDRMPRALSGGQRQRVAVGRSIIRKVGVFLMDEPLSNLDAKQRVTMRSEITQIHRETGATTIYVTHDQTEAMTMGDRIVVINRGVIQQIGTPKQIYMEPANPFVADFVGKIEFLEGEVKDGAIVLDGCGQKLPYDGPLSGKVLVGIRPEQLRFAKEGEGELSGVIKSHFYLGNENDCRVELGAGKEVRIIADPYESMDVKAGQKVSLKVRHYHAYPLDETSLNFRKILT